MRPRGLESVRRNPIPSPARASEPGQKRTGEASLAAGEKKPLEISFDLPASADPWRQAGPLTMEIKSGETTLHFDRTIEVSRNIGLRPLTMG